MNVVTIMSIENAHYFNNTSFLVEKIGYKKPAALYTQFFPDLRQKNLKMSCTGKLDEIGCINLNFTP